MPNVPVAVSPGLRKLGDRPKVARGLDWLCKLGADDRIENCQKTYEGNYRSKPQGQLPLNGEWYPDDPTNPLSQIRSDTMNKAHQKTA